MTAPILPHNQPAVSPLCPVCFDECERVERFIVVRERWDSPPAFLPAYVCREHEVALNLYGQIVACGCDDEHRCTFHDVPPTTPVATPVERLEVIEAQAAHDPLMADSYRALSAIVAATDDGQMWDAIMGDEVAA